MGLFFVFDFFELFVEGFHAEVDCFFEGVGGLCGYLVGFLGDVEADDYLLVEGGFRLDHTERHFGTHYIGITTGQFFYFLVDKGSEFLADVKVDGIDVNFHIFLLFLVHAGVQVGNYF